VRLKDGGTRVLKVGKEKDKGVFYAQVAGSADVVTLPQWMLSKVKKGPADLRNKRVFDFQEPDIASIELVHKDETVRLVREAAGADGKEPAWKATAPKEATGLKAEIVKTLATTLAGLTAKDFAADKAPAAVGLGASGQDLTVTVTLKDGSRHVLRVSAEKKDGDPYALATGEPGFQDVVLVLNQWQVSQVRKRLADLLR